MADVTYEIKRYLVRVAFDVCFCSTTYRPSSGNNTTFFTTNSGLPVWNNNSALTIGNRGPILLEDYHLVEKIAGFHRERIPERIVHARGASAKGFFEVTHDVTHLTCADFLRAPGVQTPVIVRFSTVIHERGSPETIRDPRGFATKFYTREGNWDLVGNNFPVFFVRDAMTFPDVIHAFKPNPKSHIQESWRYLDFCSFHPESMNTFAWFYDDVGIPINYRHIEGFGVQTYTFINKAGKVTYVKFHWRPTCGVKCLMDDEAVLVGGKNHSHATQDLYDSIAAGNYPEWKFYVQTMDPADEDNYDFDPLDTTKIWPEDIFPLQPVGRMVLNRNIDNFFAENEQLAFSPALVVPGIYYSDDKMLQCRVFAYNDTQRHRLGPNYLMLPANAPKCAHHNNHYDGAMNFMHRDEEVDYFPSRYDPVRHAERFPIPDRIYTGKREKAVIPKENNFKQAGDRFRTFAPDRQERFISRIVEGLSDPRITHELRNIWISYWSQDCIPPQCQTNPVISFAKDHPSYCWQMLLWPWQPQEPHLCFYALPRVLVICLVFFSYSEAAFGFPLVGIAVLGKVKIAKLKVDVVRVEVITMGFIFQQVLKSQIFKSTLPNDQQSGCCEGTMGFIFAAIPRS
ncbi:Carnitine O-acetyltransferase mitochondrial [Asimina triloba]